MTSRITGVVSLFDMLEFAATEYVEIGHHLGLMLATFQKRKSDPVEWTNAFTKVLEDCSRLELQVTRDQIAGLFGEFYDINRNNMEISVKEGDVDPNRFCHHIESLYSVLKSELRAIIFKAI